MFKIRNQLALSIGLVSSIWLVILVGFLIGSLWSVGVANSYNYMNHIVDLIGINLKYDILDNNDRAIAVKTTEFMENIEEIQRICVFNSNGNNLSSCNCNGNIKTSENDVIIEQSIEYNNESIATISMAYNKEPFLKSLKKTQLVIFWIAIIFFITATISAWIIGNIISTKINIIVSNIKQMIKTKEPTHIDSFGNNEIDQIAQAFNELSKDLLTKLKK